ncbi:MAG TPA: cupin domain-containing protein [Burkholderiales bacterium]|nr:cupin domain-containing protein [Burkholderiales bacterium]
MTQLRIIKADEVKPQNVRGHSKEAGQIKRIVATEKLFFNIDEISPGFSPHTWHRHTKYRSEGIEVEYPADFEEIYFVISGRGVIQWKTDSGEVREQAVGPGDTIHMPPGVVEHQLLNNGNETIRIAVVGVPPPKRTRI